MAKSIDPIVSRVRKFLAKVVNEESDPQDSFYQDRIPEDLLDEETKKRIQEQFYSSFIQQDSNDPDQAFVTVSNGVPILDVISLSKSESDLFNSIYESLRQDLRTDFLSDRQLKKKLWYLVCRVFLERDRYRKDTSLLKQQAEEFAQDLFKPVQDYEVLFGISNFSLVEDSIEFWDCSIFSKGKLNLVEWAKMELNSIGEERLLQLQGLTQIIVRDRGNNPQMVFDRARAKSQIRLNALQSFLAEVPYIRDQQLLFEVSACGIVRCLPSLEGNMFLRFPENAPVELVHSDSSERVLESAHKLLALIPQFNKGIREPIERAIYWIGRAINLSDWDDKVVSLCVGLETLLTSKSDLRKGEAIAYRMALLSAECESDFFAPSRILSIYETRSSVIHGSSIGIASKREYSAMLRTAIWTLKNCIKFVSREQIKDRTELIKKLDSSGYWDKFVTLLEDQVDQSSQKIIESMNQIKKQ